ncbi:MAG: sulfite exporter TauE/SafE family protein, partial [Gammaproteobacteria bacterium]|nr:sulfite exporter TauE/SafE family protein [Gammaproteobacteria bacterium]
LFFLFLWQGYPAEALMQMAVASSLATVIFTAISSTYAHHRRDAVLWQSVLLLAPGIALGSVVGAIFADYLSSDILRMVFGIFQLFVATQLVLGADPSAHRDLPGAVGMVSTGAGIGALSTLLGIGGGTFTVPFLLWCNVSIRDAVATSAACGFPIAVVGTAGLVAMSWNEEMLPFGSTGYVYWPAVAAIAATSVLGAPLGARFAHTLPVPLLRRLFAIVVAVVGIRMLV